MNNTKSIYFYMANLGSEMERVFSWREKGDNEAMEHACDRATAIIDKVDIAPASDGGKELSLLKKIIEDIKSNTQNYSIQRNSMRAYFIPFVLKMMNPA